MKKEQIENMINKRIERLYSDDSSTSFIIEELLRSSNNMQRALEKSNIIFDDFKHLDWDSIDVIRIRYVVFYTNFVLLRIKDMNWMEENKYKFSQYTNLKMFRMVLLRDKLSVKNSVKIEKKIHPFFRPSLPKVRESEMTESTCPTAYSYLRNKYGAPNM